MRPTRAFSLDFDGQLVPLSLHIALGVMGHLWPARGKETSWERTIRTGPIPEPQPVKCNHKILSAKAPKRFLNATAIDRRARRHARLPVVVVVSGEEFTLDFCATPAEHEVRIHGGLVSFVPSGGAKGKASS